MTEGEGERGKGEEEGWGCGGRGRGCTERWEMMDPTEAFPEKNPCSKMQMLE